MIPELVNPGDLSRANGFINMMTNIAVIVGTVAAGAISDAYYPQANEAAANDPAAAGDVPAAAGLPWLPGVVLVLVALAGIASVGFLGKLRAMGNPQARFDWNPFSTYWVAIREMAKGRLLMVMIAWGYFYMLAVLALLIIPEYTKILQIERFDASLLMGVLGVAVGLGCWLAGMISGHHIEPRLIPLGALGITFFFVLLAIQPSRELQGSVLLTREAWFILGAGISAGFYIIPLQALLQKLSPDQERGRFLGTANAVSFTFMTFSSVIYVGIAPLFPAQPQRIFMVCAVLMAGGALVFVYRLRGTGILLGKRRESAIS
jgi:acyl-[acyl-carrier-protein]-phospholipid O-acyltransferase/long-chain-fatty-acid--[acyl-carrier-protein] ligase